MWGTSKGYTNRILEDIECRIEVLPNFRDTYFNGMAPEPSEESLSFLTYEVKEEKADLGLATDEMLIALE
jgi:phosphomannomutase